MAIIDQSFLKWNINKMKRDGSSKDGTSSEGGGSVVITSGGNSSTNVSNVSNLTGIEGHYLWGQYFDATQDITGDMRVDGDINYSGNIWYIGDEDSDLFGTITCNRLHASDHVETDLLHSNEIQNDEKITTDSLEANSADMDEAQIDTLHSDNAYIHNLTVTGQAHFFELVIDKIKSTNGSLMITPAAGFDITRVGTGYYTLNGQTYGGPCLYFLAKDKNGKKNHNNWEIGDQLLIRDFNNAVTGTSYNVSNRYYWGIVRNVSSQPVDVEIDGEMQTCHYVIIGDTINDPHDGEWPGTDAEGASCVQCGHRIVDTDYENGQLRSDVLERQCAVYISSYNGLDTQLKAPYWAFYTGIDDFDLKPYRKSWFSSGTTLSSIPQNRIVGDIVMTSGTSYEDYINQQVASVWQDNITIELDSTNFFVPCSNENYTMLGTDGVWQTKIGLYNNGVPKYMLGSPSTTWESTDIRKQFVTFAAVDHPEAQYHYLYNITINQQALSGWHGTSPFIVPIQLSFEYDDDGTTKIDTRIVNLYFNKQIQGDNGSATTVSFGMYELVPEREEVVIDESQVMHVNLSYRLGSVEVQSNGSTTVNTLTTWPTSITARRKDDKLYTSWTNLTRSSDGKYMTYQSDSYTTQWWTKYKNNNAPTYMTIDIWDTTNQSSPREIASRVVPVLISTGSSFQLKDDAISMAVSVAGSQTTQMINGNNTTYGLTTVTNRVGALEVRADGVQSTVTGLQTTVTTQGTLIGQKVDTSTFNQTMSGFQTRVTSLETNSATKTELSSSIAQSATDITLSVTSNIDGLLSATGIHLDDKKIELTGENVDIIGNLNLYDAGAGFALYDSDGNMKINILNTELGAPTDSSIAQMYARGEAGSTGTWQNVSTVRENIGSRNAGSSVSISTIRARLMANDGSDYIYPSGTTCSVQVKICKASDDSVVKTQTVTASAVQNVDGLYEWSGSIAHTFAADGIYYVTFTATGTGSIPVSLRSLLNVTYWISYGEQLMTKIASNGFFSHQAPNSYLLSNSSEHTLKMGSSGIRVVPATYDSNGVQVAATDGNWYNYNNVRTVKMLNYGTFSSGTVVYGGSSHSVSNVYTIDPSDGYAEYIVGGGTMSGDYYVELPSVHTTPLGWHCRITQLQFGNNTPTVKIVANKDTGQSVTGANVVIQDANLNGNGSNNDNRGVRFNTVKTADFVCLGLNYTGINGKTIGWRADQDMLSL